MSGHFESKLETTPVGVQRWEVEAPLIFVTASGQRIEVPKGFITDGASVPKVLWNLYPPFDGDYDAAAVIHDWLYRHPQGFARGDVDGIFKDAMQVLGTAKRKWLLIYIGVRAGGWKPWNSYRAEESEAV